VITIFEAIQVENSVPNIPKEFVAKGSTKSARTIFSNK